VKEVTNKASEEVTKEDARELQSAQVSPSSADRSLTGSLTSRRTASSEAVCAPLPLL
jgi:hypothetical protein